MPLRSVRVQQKASERWRKHVRRLRNLVGRVASYAPLRRLAEMPLTVLGFGCIDAATVWWNAIVGLFGAGVLLIVLELMIADDASGDSR